MHKLSLPVHSATGMTPSPCHPDDKLVQTWMSTGCNVTTDQGDPLSPIKYEADCMFLCKMYRNPKAMQGLDLFA